MRLKAWAPDFRGNTFTVYDQTAPPWIEHEDKGNGPYVKLSITNEEFGNPPSGQTRVMFTEAEWPIIKARIDAAFAGGDPNQSSFYQNDDGTWKA